MNDFVVRIDNILKTKNLKRIAMCEDVGINTSIMTAWDRRNTIPSADVVFRIADYLGVSARWLVMGEEEKTKEETSLSREEEKLLADFADLSEDQKDSVLMMIEGYKQKNASHSERLFG